MKKLSLLFLMFFMTIGIAMAQRTITGTITDDVGEALIGANVMVKGTTVGTISDVDGSYSLVVPDGSETIVISYTGYGNKEMAIGDSNRLDISLSEGVLLNAAIVTALGISRDEKSLGYSVQQIGGEELANSRETNVVNALQGKVAGVQIQGSPSSLGGSSRITIRGSNSFLGDNQPLFIVDGVPINNENFATDRQQRGFSAIRNDSGSDPYDYGNMASDIDPNNIADMTVLKGAAATALYGQRGANGVILITTKDGSGQKGLGIEVNSSAQWDNVTNLIPHQQEYGGGAIADTESGFFETTIDGQTHLYPAYAKDGSWGPKYDPNTQIRHWDSWDPQSSNFGETRPWVAPNAGYEEFFETGTTFQNSIAFSGGDDKGSFRLGYNNSDQKGTMPNGTLKRNGLNFNSSYQLASRLKVGLTGNYIRTDAENRTVTGYNNANPMQAFTQWWQNQIDIDRLKNSTWTDGTQQTWNSVGPSVDDQGNFLGFNPAPRFFDNPYWVRENYLQEDTRNRFFGNVNATFDITDKLDFSTRLGTDFYQFSIREGIPNGSVETSSYEEVERRFQETNIEARLTYKDNLSDDLSFQATAGVNRMTRLTRRTQLHSVGGILLDGYYNIKNSIGSANLETDQQQSEIRSVFGVASIGFQNFLYLDLTGRNDWSSTLPDENNSYFYPSVSLSAVITDLPGIGDLGPLSFAKIRAGYAQVGLDAASYRLRTRFISETPGVNGSSRASVPDSRNNPILKPERTKEIEIGADLRFWNGRLGIDGSFFNRTSTDQIYDVPTSAATGTTSAILNAGEMRNWGWEVMITGRPIETKDFSWDLGVNLYRQNNEVVSLADDVESINLGGTWAADLRIAEGYGYMGVWGNDFVRENFVQDDEGNITTNEGRPTVDEDGNYVFTDERVFLGSAIADWTGGVSTTLNFKGFELGGLIDFQKGGIIHSTSLQWSKYSGMHPETVSFNGVDDVRAEGLILPGVDANGNENTIAVDPQTYYTTYWSMAAPNVYDASFVKLRELRLGYNIPNSLLGNSGLKDISVGVFGRNLAILAADLPYLDPQGINGSGNVQGLENAQVPSTRSFGINVRFKL